MIDSYHHVSLALMRCGKGDTLAYYGLPTTLPFTPCLLLPGEFSCITPVPPSSRVYYQIAHDRAIPVQTYYSSFAPTRMGPPSNDLLMGIVFT